MPGPNFHEPVELHIGRQTRAIMFTPKALKRASKALKMEARTAFATAGDEALYVLAAVGMQHAEPDLDDERVCVWVTNEPKTMLPLIKAVGEALRRFYVVTGVLREDGEEPGEATPPASNP